MTGELIVDYRTQLTSTLYGFASTWNIELKPNTTYTLVACGYISQEQKDAGGKLAVMLYSPSWSSYDVVYIDSTTPTVNQYSVTVGTTELSRRITCYSYPSSVAQPVTLLWYKLIEGVYDFDIFDAYGACGFGKNIFSSPSQGYSLDGWNKAGPTYQLSLDTTTFDFPCVKGDGMYRMATRDWTTDTFKPNTLYTVSFEAYCTKVGTWSNPFEGGTVIAEDLSVTNNRLNKWSKYWAVLKKDVKPNVVFYLHNNTQYWVRNAKLVEGDYRYNLSWTDNSDITITATDNFVELQSKCRNPLYFVGKENIATYPTNIPTCNEIQEKSTDHYLVPESFLTDFNGKKAILSFEYTATNWKGKRAGFEPVIPLENGNRLYLGCWLWNQVNGSGTFYYIWDSRDYSLAVSGTVTQLRMYVQETTEGTITISKPQIALIDTNVTYDTVKDLVAWNGLYYIVRLDSKTEVNDTWTTSSINVSKSPTTNVSKTGGTVTLSATATQVRGSISYKRFVYSNNTYGPWYIVSEGQETQTVDINSSATFSNVSGIGTISNRIVTIPENQTTQTRTSTWKVTWDSTSQEITITQEAGTTTYTLTLNSVSTIPASGGSVSISGVYKTFWNGSTTASSTVTVNPTLTGSSTPSGWTVSGNTVSAPSRGTVIGTTLTATGTAKYGSATANYTVSQAANTATYSEIIPMTKYTSIVAASGGTTSTPSVTYSQTATFTSGSTSRITSGATINYSNNKIAAPNPENKGFDPLFTHSTNNIGNYDNNNTGKNSLTRLTNVTNPIAGTNILRWQNTGTGTTPYLGGIYMSFQGENSKTYYCTIVAKIPVGYQIKHQYNQMGTGSTEGPLTSTEGTGDWQTYVWKATYGTGTISTIFFFCFIGTAGTIASPVTVDIASIFVTTTGTPGSGLNTATGVWTLPSSGTEIDNLGGLVASNRANRITEIEINLNGKTAYAYALPVQAANYATQLTVSGGSLAYPTIGAGVTSATPTVGNMHSSFTFTSGASTTTTPDAKYGSVSISAVYTLDAVQNGFTAVNSFTGVLTATHRGSTVGNSRLSGLVTRKVTVIWTPTEKFMGSSLTGVGTNSARSAQQANLVTSIVISHQNISYSNIAPNATSASVTRATLIGTYTYSSGSTTLTPPGSAYGTLVISQVYSLASSQNGFTAVNSSTGALTATALGTTISNARTSAEVTQTSNVTWTHSSTYGGSIVKSNQVAARATCTQNGNYVTSITLNSAAFSYAKISPSATSATPSKTNNSPVVTFTFTTGSTTTTTPNSTYGTLVTSDVFKMPTEQNGFKLANTSTGVLSATNMGTTLGNRSSNTVTRTMTATWTPTASYNSAGTKTASTSATATCTQGENIETFNSVLINTQSESGYSDMIPASGGRTTFYIPIIHCTYTSGATRDEEVSTGVTWSITTNPSNKFGTSVNPTSTWRTSVTAQTRGTNNNDTESGSQLNAVLTLSITKSGTTKTATKTVSQAANNYYDKRIALTTPAGATTYTIPAGGGSITLYSSVYRGYPSGSERSIGNSWGTMSLESGDTSAFTISSFTVSGDNLAIIATSAKTAILKSRYGNLTSPDFTIKQAENKITSTVYTINCSYPAMPSSGGTINITDNSKVTYTWSSGTVQPMAFTASVSWKNGTGYTGFSLNPNRSITASSNNSSQKRYAYVICSAPNSTSQEITITQEAGLAEFKLVSPNPSNYSSSNPLTFVKGTKILCEFSGVTDAYQEVSQSQNYYSLQKYADGINKAYLMNNYGVNNVLFDVVFTRKVDSATAPTLWTKSVDGSKSITVLVRFTISNQTSTNISFGKSGSISSSATCYLTFNDGSSQTAVFKADLGSGSISSKGTYSPIYDYATLTVTNVASSITNISMRFDGRSVSPSSMNCQYSTSGTGWSTSGNFWRDNILNLSTTYSGNLAIPSAGPQSSLTITNTIVIT